ncbi:MAG: cobalt transporter [Isosphaeraceae bacterium]|jgi:Cu(I)/Ag(I) efflux system membrane fusion protein|nr:MAG: cobalt transporter [Isosphaeraceae bacterium]
MMKRSLLLIVPMLALPVLWKLWGAPAPASEKSSVAQADATPAEEATKYTCAMHPQIVSGTSGTCPICGMDLVPVAGSQSLAPEPGGTMRDDSGRKVLYWYDPMVPGKQFDKPGKSPFMDMELVPKYADESDGDDAGGGKPVVTVTAENLQKMGVRTAKVATAGLGRAIRATGIVKENERSRREIASQVEGRVTELKASAVGDAVKAGQPFYSLYSPELLTLQNDYIVALETGLDDIAAAARRRMKLLGVDDGVLDTIAKGRKAMEEVPFQVPADGILSRLEIRKGAYLMAGAMVGSIEDLSTIWVETAVPEGDLPAVRVGDDATVTLTGETDPFEAKVDYVYPEITPETRTGKVRLVIGNKDGRLKPAAYVMVRLGPRAVAEGLSVPSEAVLRTSTGDHVIVALGEGKFQAREVKTRMSGGDRTEILEGLREGEEVVTSAQFLIDSESSLRESLQKLSGGPHAGH